MSDPAYTAEKLREYNNKTVTYNGEEMSLYDATQRQRYIERQIRKWKREESALDSAGLDNGFARMKIREWQARQRDFVGQTGLSRDYFRERAGVQNMPSSDGGKPIGVYSSQKPGIIKTKQEEPLLEKLPNAVSASTTQEKIQGYLLNSNHPVGGNKAKVIRSVLGYHYENWDILSDKMYRAVQDAPVVQIVKTHFGVKYETHLLVEGEKGKSLMLRTIWQIDNGSDIPRLVTVTFDRRKGVKR